MNIDASSRDQIIRTVIGEAANEPPEGQAAVTHVILNRVGREDYGATPYQVVHQPGAFEAWQRRAKELNGIRPDSPQYQSAAAIVDGVLSGQISDPTGGANHYLNPTLQKQLGRKQPDWATGQPSARIGNHVFFSEPFDWLSKWDSSSPPAAPSSASSNYEGRDWLAEFAKADDDKPTPLQITIPRRALAGEVVPVPGDESPAEWTNRMLAEHQGQTWSDLAARLRLGAYRGVGDVADTLATGISGAGRYGANALTSAGIVSHKLQRQ
jgi:hypothetical protein